MSDYKQIALSIAEELEQHPERWTQGTYAIDSDGRDVCPEDPAAVSFCLSGHIQRRGCPLFGAVYETFFRECRHSLSIWNDQPGRNSRDVIALCKRIAGVAEVGNGQ